jgi:hypothetical protein
VISIHQYYGLPLLLTTFVHDPISIEALVQLGTEHQEFIGLNMIFLATCQTGNLRPGIFFPDVSIFAARFRGNRKDCNDRKWTRQ